MGLRQGHQATLVWTYGRSLVALRIGFCGRNLAAMYKTAGGVAM